MKKILVCFSLVVLLPAWKATAAPYIINPDSVHAQIAVLASDSLEGRETGTPGEWKAAQYVAKEFSSAGLLPRGDSGGYFQSFTFIRKISPGPKNWLTVNGKALKLDDNYTPLPQSANMPFSFKGIVSVDYGIVTEDSSYNDYSNRDVVGKAVLIKRFAPSSESNPHIDFDRYSSLTDKINAAVEHKVAGIILVTPEDRDDTLQPLGVAHITPKEIPILFVKRAALQELGLDPYNLSAASVEGETELVPVRGTGHNVVGYLPARSDTVIVIGAHYDHLGYGGPGSRYHGAEPRIHPGADDNASGTAGLMELAHYFTSIKDSLHYSLLFIAFTGEEEGILGSSYFVKNPTVDPDKMRMMVNMDMIGRLRDQENGLAIFGIGTAAEFKTYFDSLKTDQLKLSFREPGTGPSDHTAFYNAKIPVLHFFTGAHEDYHTPNDTVDKIDFPGVVKVTDLIAGIVMHFDRAGVPLTFQKTKGSEAGKRRAQYSVTLGVMPDYVADVKGLKVDGITPDRPAERGGILKGDIVIKLGDFPIEDIYGYMSALSKFRKGDSTSVVVTRGSDTLKLPIVFK
jgi:aminopeptidase YwaD